MRVSVAGKCLEEQEESMQSIVWKIYKQSICNILSSTIDVMYSNTRKIWLIEDITRDLIGWGDIYISAQSTEDTSQHGLKFRKWKN